MDKVLYYEISSFANHRANYCRGFSDNKFIFKNKSVSKKIYIYFFFHIRKRFSKYVVARADFVSLGSNNLQ